MYTEIHNIIEDIVYAQVVLISETIEKEDKDSLCTCHQCRIDTACFVLNRIPPKYVISNRGVARVERKSFEYQQQEADIIAMIYDGLKRVNHNQRPNANHQSKVSTNPPLNTPSFNIPTIIGNLYNGINFEPMSDVMVELRRNGELVRMKDGNWQNPYHLVANTHGTFTFWPASIPAAEPDTHELFEYTIRVIVPEFETLTHFLKIPVISELRSAGAYSMARTFKLPDLYMFPPGGEEEEDL